jgi:hypothetical protein
MTPQSGENTVEEHPPRDRIFRRQLQAELERMRLFLGETNVD